MRALVCRQYGPIENLSVEERDDPVAGNGEVLVDIAAAGLNFPDLLVINGAYQVKIPPPFIPGGEAAGTVLAVGAGVSEFRPGDRVILAPMIGAFAERCAVPASQCMPMPEAMDFPQAAGFTFTYATTYHAFRQCAQLRAGETVLVLGAAGGVGSAAVEIAVAMGARVIAAASTDDKLAFAKECGADDTVNYSRDSLKDAVRELTSGQGADVVYDPVGGELAGLAYRSLAWHGRYLVIGFASGDIPSFPANIALLKEASVTGVWWGTWSSKNPDAAVANLAELAALVESGALKPRVTASYPLEHFEDAFGAIARRQAMGKIVFTP
jgi:NADPH2:quinone reductase